MAVGVRDSTKSATTIFWVAAIFLVVSLLVSFFCNVSKDFEDFVLWLDDNSGHILLQTRKSEAYYNKKTSKEEHGLNFMKKLGIRFLAVGSNAYRILIAILASDLLFYLCEIIDDAITGSSDCASAVTETAVLGTLNCTFAGKEESEGGDISLGSAFFAALVISVTVLLCVRHRIQVHVDDEQEGMSNYEWMAIQCELTFGHFIGFRWDAIMEKMLKRDLSFQAFFSRASIGFGTLNSAFYGNQYYGFKQSADGSMSLSPSGPASSTGSQNLWSCISVDPLSEQTTEQCKGGQFVGQWPWNVTSAHDMLMSKRCFLMDPQYCTEEGFVAVGPATQSRCEYDDSEATPHCIFKDAVQGVMPMFLPMENGYWDELWSRSWELLVVIAVAVVVYLLLNRLLDLALWAIAWFQGVEEETAIVSQVADALRESTMSRTKTQSVKLHNSQALKDEEEEMEEELRDGFQDLIADALGLACGMYMCNVVYWWMTMGLLWLDPAGSSGWSSQNGGFGGSNAVGEYAPGSTRIYLVALFLWPKVLQTGLLLVEMANNAVENLQIKFNICTANAQCWGFKFEEGSILYKLSNFGIVIQLSTVTLTWGMGALLFNLVKVICFMMFLDNHKQFRAWCDYGFTAVTPTFPVDNDVLETHIDDSVLSSFGLCILLHAVCLPVVAYYSAQLEILEFDRWVLSRMEGVVQDGLSKAYQHEFRPMTFGLWKEIMMHEPLMQNKDEAALEQLFNAYDTDFDGIISKKEMKELLDSRNEFAQIDTDCSQDGQITRKEWIFDGRPVDHYDLFDLDANGNIDRQEWKVMSALQRRFDRVCQFDKKSIPSEQRYITKPQWEAAYPSQGSRFELFYPDVNGRVFEYSFLYYELLESQFKRMAHETTSHLKHAYVTKEQWDAFFGTGTSMKAGAPNYTDFDTDGNGTVYWTEWKDAHSKYQNNLAELYKMRHFKEFVTVASESVRLVEEAMADMDKMKMDTAAKREWMNDNAKRLAELARPTQGAVHRLGLDTADPQAIQKQQEFNKQRHEVMHKQGHNVSWLRKVIHAQEMAAAIAIALSYECLFDGLVDYVLSVAAAAEGDESDCGAELRMRAGILAVSLGGFLGTAGILRCASLSLSAENGSEAEHTQRVGSPKMTGYDSGIELSEKDPLVDNAKLCDGTTNSQECYGALTTV